MDKLIHLNNEILSNTNQLSSLMLSGKNKFAEHFVSSVEQCMLNVRTKEAVSCSESLLCARLSPVSWLQWGQVNSRKQAWGGAALPKDPQQEEVQAWDPRAGRLLEAPPGWAGPGTRSEAL